MWQHASFPEVVGLISAICDDFHNMGTSIAKLKHFWKFRGQIPLLPFDASPGGRNALRCKSILLVVAPLTPERALYRCASFDPQAAYADIAVRYLIGAH